MSYEEIYREIILQNYNYITQHNLKPNNIILGISVYEMLQYSYDLKLELGTSIKKILGMDITIDRDNSKVIKVGYMETSTMEVIQ